MNELRGLAILICVTMHGRGFQQQAWRTRAHRLWGSFFNCVCFLTIYLRLTFLLISTYAYAFESNIYLASYWQRSLRMNYL